MASLGGVPQDGFDVALEDGSEVAPWTVYETSSSDFFVRMWPGFNAGVRIAMRAN